ncbi:alpha/beta hydrolase [Aeromicrobium sp. NPDC092404]|uniref:alpha/beta hydrolase n=1 Tax=Aeromicrobium sp. NPDC092404 TaxID=3154976 RepID=UPI003428DC43
MRKTLSCAAAAISLTALTLTVPSLAQAEPATAATATAASSISWGTCSSQRLQAAGAQCAKVSVPLDWSKPSGTRIKLAISRIKHTVPASQYQGVMLVNPGGPGGSGLGLSVLGEYVPEYAGKNVGGAYDWIGFDPRGVGSSEPAVSCDDDYFGFNRPRYVPTTKAIETAWKGRTNSYTDDCDAKNGAILSHLTTIDSAKDMDAIRAALGVSQINYYGFSYGTYLGQVYATRYPTRVRRLVFDGTVDPRGVWYKANLAQDVAFDKNINTWFSWLASHDDHYHLGDTGPEVKALFYDTQEALYQNPVDGPEGKIGGSEWNDSFIYAGYYQSTWLDLAQVFAGYVNDNDVESLSNAFIDANGLGDDNGYAVYTGVQCTDTAWPKSWATWKADNDKIHAVAPFLTWGNAWYNEPCRHWPAPSRTLQPITSGNKAKLLMLSETDDAATPYPGSIEVRKRFPLAALVTTLGGTTHSNSLNGNACIDDTIARFLYNGSRPHRKAGNYSDKYCTAPPKPDPGAEARKSAPSKVDRLLKDAQKSALRF